MTKIGITALLLVLTAGLFGATGNLIAGGRLTLDQVFAQSAGRNDQYIAGRRTKGDMMKLGLTEHHWNGREF